MENVEIWNGITTCNYWKWIERRWGFGHKTTIWSNLKNWNVINGRLLVLKLGQRCRGGWTTTSSLREPKKRATSDGAWNQNSLGIWICRFIQKKCNTLAGSTWPVWGIVGVFLRWWSQCLGFNWSFSTQIGFQLTKVTNLHRFLKSWGIPSHHEFQNEVMVIHDDWMMIWGTMTLETTKNLPIASTNSSYFGLVVSNIFYFSIIYGIILPID